MGVRCGVGISFRTGIDAAIEQCAEMLGAQLAGDERAGDVRASGADLLCVFASGAHAGEVARATGALRAMFDAGVTIGTGAEGVLGGTRESLGEHGAIVAWAARLPGARLTPVRVGELVDAWSGEPGDPAGLSGPMGAAEDLRALVVVCDPFSVPIVGLLPAMCAARARDASGVPIGFIAGGMASAGRHPRENVMVLDDEVLHEGGVGVAISGGVRVDPILSQGCRPIGRTHVITKAQKNMVYTLGGRRALEVVQETIMELPDRDKKLLSRGLFMGRVVNEYQDRFGRGDFLVRGVNHADENTGAIAVGDLVRTGQTVQLHVRDADSASQDLAMLLDAQTLHGPPAGVLAFTCNGRGTRLFDRLDHDALALSRLFDSVGTPGPQMARVGREIDTGRATPAIGGMFAAGEIGPVGGESYLHGHSVSALVFRECVL
ncbi:MAG: FIST N-terminal domain-containing protein [Phycisphaerales bacterium]|jgi:small ligand-binding sensory domain FIST|nr:FIST N-terminal domain-containing protein [Phycisphaerales bacterium]